MWIIDIIRSLFTISNICIPVCLLLFSTFFFSLLSIWFYAFTGIDLLFLMLYIMYKRTVEGKWFYPLSSFRRKALGADSHTVQSETELVAALLIFFLPKIHPCTWGIKLDGVSIESLVCLCLLKAKRNFCFFTTS